MSKLKAAIDEIEAVLKMYQLGGVVSIANDQQMAHKVILPEWSTAKLLTAGVSFDISPDNAARVVGTVQFFLALEESTKRAVAGLGTVIEAIEEAMPERHLRLVEGA